MNKLEDLVIIFLDLVDNFLIKIRNLIPWLIKSIKELSVSLIKSIKKNIINDRWFENFIILPSWLRKSVVSCLSLSILFLFVSITFSVIKGGNNNELEVASNDNEISVEELIKRKTISFYLNKKGDQTPIINLPNYISFNYTVLPFGSKKIESFKVVASNGAEDQEGWKLVTASDPSIDLENTSWLFFEATEDSTFVEFSLVDVEEKIDNHLDIAKNDNSSKNYKDSYFKIKDKSMREAELAKIREAKSAKETIKETENIDIARVEDTPRFEEKRSIPSLKKEESNSSDEKGFVNYKDFKFIGKAKNIKPQGESYYDKINKASLVSEIDFIAEAIGKLESSGRYNAIGKNTNSKGNRAYGKYQVMDYNIPNWSRQALGYEMSVSEFLNSPEAQDVIARYKMGKYYEKYGNIDDVASIWFSGKPASGNNSSDVNGTSVPTYIKIVRKNYRDLKAAAAKLSVVQR